MTDPKLVDELPAVAMIGYSVLDDENIEE